MKQFNKLVFRFFIRYRFFGFALLIAVVCLILEVSSLNTASHWLLGISALVLLLPLLVAMYEDLRTGAYGIEILALTAIIFSVVLHQYWAALVLVIVLSGNDAFEDYAILHARNGLDYVLERSPRVARIIRGKRTIESPVLQVKVGDRIRLEPGDVVPVDGTIIEGNGEFDKSLLTGVKNVLMRSPADYIRSGWTVTSTPVIMKALHTAAASQYQQIARLIRSAGRAQAPFVRQADRYSILFTLLALAIGGIAWYASGSALRFLEVITVATPIPLIITPSIAIIGGMNNLARNGIVARTGYAMERLSQARTFAFVKTGTLTPGKPTIDEVISLGGYSEDEIFKQASAICETSDHRLSKAITAAARAQNIRFNRGHNVRATPAQGLSGSVSGKKILVGRLPFLLKHRVTLPNGFSAKSIHKTAVYIAVDSMLEGVITFSDQVRPESKPMVRKLKQLGVKHIMMLTADSATVARSTGKQLGIDEIYADTLPVTKLHIVENAAQKPVVFVGDSVNDAPVLTAADVGMTLAAHGSNAATESADIAILADDVSRVALSRQISSDAIRTAKQSAVIGSAISIVLMFISALGFIRPVYGVGLQEVINIAVVIYALRVYRYTK